MMLYAYLSALAFAVVVCFDRLTMADLYKGNNGAAWFVSSALGSILGLIATLLAWGVYWGNSYFLGTGIPQLSLPAWLIADQGKYAIAFIFTGAMTSLTLFSHFRCFNQGVMSTTVSMVIAAMPLLVFALEALIAGDTWNMVHYICIFVTVGGLILFEQSSEVGERNTFQVWLALGMYFVLGSVYMVILEVMFPAIETEYGVTTSEVSLLGMPFYWIGFGVGVFAISKQSVRDVVRSTLNRRSIIAFVIMLEIFGAEVYFFEYLGISEIDATYVALITGAHIILVWGFDLYLGHRYKQAGDSVKIFDFEVDKEFLEDNDMSKHTIALRSIALVMVIGGLVFWPS